MFNGIFPIRQFHSHPRRAGSPRVRVAAQAQRDHPAAPEQLDHGFEEGFLRAPRSPETRRIGRFSTGVEQLPSTGRRGRFSDGGEQLPETPQKTAERRFSEGMEHKVVK
jgi:hypothetical protein